jgi:hypothetical protein
LVSLSIEKWICGRNERLGAVLFRSRECVLKIVNASHAERLKFDSQRLGRSLHVCEGQVSPSNQPFPRGRPPGQPWGRLP